MKLLRLLPDNDHRRFLDGGLSHLRRNTELGRGCRETLVSGRIALFGISRGTAQVFLLPCSLEHTPIRPASMSIGIHPAGFRQVALGGSDDERKIAVQSVDLRSQDCASGMKDLVLIAAIDGDRSTDGETRWCRGDDG